LHRPAGLPLTVQFRGRTGERSAIEKLDVDSVDSAHQPNRLPMILVIGAVQHQPVIAPEIVVGIEPVTYALYRAATQTTRVIPSDARQHQQVIPIRAGKGA